MYILKLADTDESFTMDWRSIRTSIWKTLIPIWGLPLFLLETVVFLNRQADSGALFSFLSLILVLISVGFIFLFVALSVDTFRDAVVFDSAGIHATHKGMITRSVEWPRSCSSLLVTVGRTGQGATYRAKIEVAGKDGISFQITGLNWQTRLGVSETPDHVRCRCYFCGNLAVGRSPGLHAGNRAVPTARVRRLHQFVGKKYLGLD